jgi:integrase
MARKATGQVIPPKDGRAWALRFRAYGSRRYVTLGTAEDGWDRQRADAELRHVLADVERGIWRPPEPDPVPELVGPEPTFHEFASEWLEARRPELRERTAADYEWALSCHLLPFFAKHRLSEISVEEVDRYRAAKVREGRLSPNVVNKTLTRLAQVLEVAVEYGHLDRNPARGRRRRLKATRPKRTWLEPEQAAPLLDAAGAIDADRRSDDPGGRRAMLATLILAGLRIGELTALRWRDVDLASGRLRVGDAKTDAGRRTVDLSPALRDELAAHKATTRHAGPGELVFCTRSGRAQNRNNIRRRILLAAVKLANEEIAEGDEVASPLPDGLSPHALRHTFASLLFEAGATVPYVMAQLGHADPKVTLSIYAHVLRRKGDTGDRLDALVRAADWAATGSEAAGTVLEPTAVNGGTKEKTPH